MADKGFRTKQKTEGLSPQEQAVLKGHLAVLEEQRKDQLKQSAARLDRRIEEMAENAANYIEKYGEEDFRAQMLTMFLEIAIEMREAVDLISSVNTAIQFMYNCIGFIDDSLQFNFDLQDQSLATKYGFFDRLKIRRRNRRAAANNANRMRIMMEQMGGQLDMARSMMDNMQYACTKMRESMAASQRRRAKQEAKRAKKGEVKTRLSGGNKAATEMIAAILAKRRGTELPPEDTSSAKGAGGSAATKGDSDITNIDDIT